MHRQAQQPATHSAYFMSVLWLISALVCMLFGGCFASSQSAPSSRFDSDESEAIVQSAEPEAPLAYAPREESVKTEEQQEEDIDKPIDPFAAEIVQRDSISEDPSLLGAKSSTTAADPNEALPRSETLTATKRVRIYRADVHMAVFQVQQAIETVHKIGSDAGGYMSMREQSSIVIRIPAERFHEVMEKILQMGNVLARDIRVDDVTEQYYDLLLRLKNARVMRDRMVQLLASAKTVEDTLKVEKELNRISTEIERLEGRFKMLQDQIRMATISVRFSPQRSIQQSPVFELPFVWMRQLGLQRLMRLY